MGVEICIDRKRKVQVSKLRNQRGMERLGRRWQKRKETHLGIESRDLAIDDIANLLGVGVVEEVVLDLFGMGSHLMKKISEFAGREVQKESCERI